MRVGSSLIQHLSGVIIASNAETIFFGGCCSHWESPKQIDLTVRRWYDIAITASSNHEYLSTKIL